MTPPAERTRQYRERRYAAIALLPKIQCACGCGTGIAPLGRLLKAIRYAHGHNPDGKATRFVKGHATWNLGRTGPLSPGWQGGVGVLPYGPGFTRKSKRAILDRDGHRCRRCGNPQSELKRKLQVHHLDHDKANNDPSNLVASCCACNIWASYHRDQPFGM